MGSDSPETVQIGPFPWWRWAVVAKRGDIPGIGFWSRTNALEFWNRVQRELPDHPAPFLLKRTGFRTYRAVR